MSFDRASDSNVMAFQICLGIPFQLLIAMIYYGPQSDIRVKTFARKNSCGSCMLNYERRNRLLALFEDPMDKLWSFVYAMGFIFILRASQQIMSSDRASEYKVMVV